MCGIPITRLISPHTNESISPPPSDASNASANATAALIVAVGVTEDNALSEFRSRRFGYQVFAFATTLIVLLFGGIAVAATYGIGTLLGVSQLG